MYARDKIIEILSEIDYLGDIFQQNGRNSELVKDRLKRGLKVILNDNLPGKILPRKYLWVLNKNLNVFYQLVHSRSSYHTPIPE